MNHPAFVVASAAAAAIHISPCFFYEEAVCSMFFFFPNVKEMPEECKIWYCFHGGNMHLFNDFWTHHLTPVTTLQWLKLLPGKNNLFSQSSFCYSLNFNWWVHSGSLSLMCLSCLAGCAAQHPPSLSCLLLTCKRGWCLPDQAGPLQFRVAPLIYTAGLNLEGVSGLPSHPTVRTQS